MSQLLASMNNKTRGFTLLEVLVALTVLSIGLLGIAGMQLFSLKSSQDSSLRTHATYIAYGIIDKMRANRVQALAGTYDIALSTGPSGAQNCYSNICNPTQLAAFELNLWKCELGSYATDPICTAIPFNVTPALPIGNGSVALDAVNNQITVRVIWRDSANRKNLDLVNTPPQSLQIVAQL